MPVSVHDELLLGHSLCRYMAIGISIMAVYILGFYSLLDMKYVTVKVAHPAHPNETHWVSRLSSFYTDNKVVIDILYNHLLSLTIPCLSLVVVVVATSITVGKLRATLAWRQKTANKPSSGQAKMLIDDDDCDMLCVQKKGRILTGVCFVLSRKADC